MKMHNDCKNGCSSAGVMYKHLVTDCVKQEKFFSWKKCRPCSRRVGRGKPWAAKERRAGNAALFCCPGEDGSIESVGLSGGDKKKVKRSRAIQL